MLAVLLGLVNAPSICVWAGFGTALRPWLSHPGRVRVFNIGMVAAAHARRLTLASEDLMDSLWPVKLESDSDPALRQDILAPLLADNEVAGCPARRGLLAAMVRDGAGVVMGGLWGRNGDA